ncbi:Hypothetical_protein [Hexamita inflata]|uniref:Hypothetical_protein n=1 Tax=Hexamita inflata TaxID=28002 RepID=A0AA86QQL6_9EUKA|nr:Hypothetical protein HINF_LOCUS44979 [Hexamita inflata]
MVAQTKRIIMNGPILIRSAAPEKMMAGVITANIIQKKQNAIIGTVGSCSYAVLILKTLCIPAQSKLPIKVLSALENTNEKPQMNHQMVTIGKATKLDIIVCMMLFLLLEPPAYKQASPGVIKSTSAPHINTNAVSPLLTSGV